MRKFELQVTVSIDWQEKEFKEWLSCRCPWVIAWKRSKYMRMWKVIKWNIIKL